MRNSSEHCAFVLLAEFDIDDGAQLTYQFPQPLGTNERLLADLMIPDGAEKQQEDWTIFFLNQTPFNTIAPVLALESEPGLKSNGDNVKKPDLLYVLNLVRTKMDSSVRRGALVKAMAICTRHPFIQIFKPVLLMALDDYFNEPSQECLARLFDAVNAMDISLAPTLTRDEKLIMRVSERKDVFAEKFAASLEAKRPSTDSGHGHGQGHGHSHSLASTANTLTGAAGTHPYAASSAYAGSNRDTLVMHASEGGSRSSFEGGSAKERSRTDSIRSHQSNSEASFALGGNPVWVGDESNAEDDSHTPHAHNNVQAQSQKGRKSMDTNSVSSHGMHGTRKEEVSTPGVHIDPFARAPKDTHFYSTCIVYRGHTLPIKLPLSTFSEEVGDYSLISLVQTFSSPNATLSGPQHPHLHSNGSLTHPIILLFNALVTGKRIIFLGYQRPAGQVSSFVLAACALGSGCGSAMRGYISRAFPYANLTNREEWETIPGYIAGVTNPIFEQVGAWDLLCDIGTGRVVVHKDIHISCPVTSVSAPVGSLLPRSGTLKAETSAGNEDDMGRQIPSQLTQGTRSDIIGKADSSDNMFMEDIVSAISLHFGEPLVRARFMEYVLRFVRLAARYEEEFVGSTKIGYPSVPFALGSDGYFQLGSGLPFTDDVSVTKELSLNAQRIEGWRKTVLYEYYIIDFQHHLATKPIQGYDLYYQLVRLRTVKNMSDAEAELIMRTLVESIQSYEQVVEFLAVLPQYLGGLLPVSFSLFHQQEHIRDLTVELLTVLRAYPIGVQFLQGLNHFHRYAYVRQAHLREAKTQREPNSLLSPPMTHLVARTPSNRSESSLS